MVSGKEVPVTSVPGKVPEDPQDFAKPAAFQDKEGETEIVKPNFSMKRDKRGSRYTA